MPENSNIGIIFKFVRSKKYKWLYSYETKLLNAITYNFKQVNLLIVKEKSSLNKLCK